MSATSQPGPIDGPHSNFLIVGVGGSAGAIGPLKEFFSNVPRDSGMAYVVILHLSPDHESRLAEVLQTATPLPVLQVRERMLVKPDHVYVMAPNKSMSMSDGTLELSDITGFDERRAPIDIFFRTLADTHDSRAVSVVMSGTGTDGSMGVRRVKENDGLVLVQEPSEAEFNEMPRNSIATGLVDFVLPVAEMPLRIIAYRDQRRALDAFPDPPAGDESRVLSQIFGELRARTGHDFSNYKMSTVMRRIDRRLAIQELPDLNSYVTFLKKHPEESHALLKELLISVTNFFRDRDVFDAVGRSLIPKLFEGKTAEDRVRVWVAGCATGEEAYSLAMLLSEYSAARGSGPEVQIFATDLDEKAISHARAGCYSETDVADVSPERLREFFVREKDGFRVRRELREMVMFAHHNLIKDPPFSHLDFVTCRNVLIYLNRAAQERAMEMVHFGLNPGGYLLLGTSESVESGRALFTTVDKDRRIYVSRGVSRKINMSARRGMAMSTPLARISAPVPNEPEQANPPLAGRLPLLSLHQELLELYAPPSIIIDGEYNIVHLTARAGRYLQFQAGEATLNLLEVIRPELRTDLRAALSQAGQTRTTVEARAIAVHTDEGLETIQPIVRPVPGEGADPGELFLVLFANSNEIVEPISKLTASAEPAARQFELELARFKEQTRISSERYENQAEEFKAANEELQALNEELRSSGEELETSQEELQSLNEELLTVNQELKVRVDEVTHAGNDLRNLMASTEIGTIFLDRSLRVKLFTPRSRDIFNLIAGDVGRPLMDITSKLSLDDLSEDATRVLEHLQTIEREVESRDGRWHLVRMLPYRTADDRIDGVVITFLDITARRHAESVARELEERSREALELLVAERTAELMSTQAGAETERQRLQAIFAQSPTLVAVLAGPEHRFEFANEVFARSVGRTSAQLLGNAVTDVFPELAAQGHLAVYDRVYQTGKEERSQEDRVELSRGEDQAIEETYWNYSVQPLRNPEGAVDRLVVHGIEVSEQVFARRRIESLLDDRARLLGQVVEAQELERQRIARELHDEMGQHLTALKIGLEGLSARTAGSTVNRLTTIVSRIDEGLDRLALELRPPALDAAGLADAIAALGEEFHENGGPRVDLQTSSAGVPLPDAIEITLYRVLQEALTNVRKHASATTVSVILDTRPDHVQMVVEDDGRGFDPESVRTGPLAKRQFGIMGMRERLSLVGGTFHLESSPGQGTSIFVRVPLPGGGGD